MQVKQLGAGNLFAFNNINTIEISTRMGIYYSTQNSNTINMLLSLLVKNI